MPLILARIQGDQITRLPTAASSIAAAAQSEPEGVYTVTRTYEGDSVVLFDAHLDRLERSAREEHIPAHIDRPALRAALRSLVETAGFSETRLRLTLPRAKPDQLLAALEPLPPPGDNLRSDGVGVCTVDFHRRHPSVKTNRQEALRAEIRLSMPAGTFEGLIVGRDNQILEGLSSNFFSVLQNRLHTASAGILEGISRRIVLEVVPVGLPVVLQPVKLAQIPDLQEAFMSSSSRGVLPVVTIDGEAIGEGRPGPYTGQIIQAYDAWVAGHVEPL